MSLIFTNHTDPREFHDAVIDHLLLREVECCALIGLIRRMQRDGYKPVSTDELDRPLLCTIHSGPRLELVAVQTLKTTMMITRAPDDVIEHLAKELTSRHWSGTILIGVVPSIQRLADHYSLLSDRPRSLVCRLRVFQLERITWPRPTTGAIRLCRPEDRETLASFMTGFNRAVGEPLEENILTRADRAIADQRIFFWTDPHPVAMAGWAGPTPNGVRINSVYTPHEFRNRGYASNLVAHLTQRLLDLGYRYCFLFTDLANPTSNRIYQQMGYRPVSDSERWKFGAALVQT